jgi:hypothetical protein
MAIKRRWKIGFGLLAVALFGASIIDTCLAEETGSEGSAERSGSPARSGDSGAGEAAKPNAGVKAGNSTVPNSGNLDGIDTRITVIPRRSGNGPEKPGNAKVIKIAPRNLLARPNLAPPAPPVVRNAIGLSVGHVGGFEQRLGEHHDLLIVPHASPATIGSAAGASGRLVVKGASPFQRTPPAANQIIKPALANRGTINGTSLTRPGAASASIGGPAKTAAELNGTAIRSKH